MNSTIEHLLQNGPAPTTDENVNEDIRENMRYRKRVGRLRVRRFNNTAPILYLINEHSLKEVIQTYVENNREIFTHSRQTVSMAFYNCGPKYREAWQKLSNEYKDAFDTTSKHHNKQNNYGRNKTTTCGKCGEEFEEDWPFHLRRCPERE